METEDLLPCSQGLATGTRPGEFSPYSHNLFLLCSIVVFYSSLEIPEKSLTSMFSVKTVYVFVISPMCEYPIHIILNSKEINN
jgi:hypothetical protein